MDDLDAGIRLKAFSFLEDLCAKYGLALPRTILATGFDFNGKRVPLLGPQGIFKPAALSEIPISITTILIVQIRKDILEESDGPLLIHGLKEWHKKELLVIPHAERFKPRAEFLEERFELFRKAG